jgi:hypothetical protein
MGETKIRGPVLITGATGFIGCRLVKRLFQYGCEKIHILSRDPDKAQDSLPSTVKCFKWNVEKQIIDEAAFKDVEYIIHLAGESIMALRWTKAKKERVTNSRVNSTNLLLKTLKDSGAPVKKILSASAIGYYGDRGNEVLTCNSKIGEGFLSEVCRQWEDGLKTFCSEDLKTYSLRFGLVLGKEGGALKMMLPPFKMGLGGVVGSGKQYMSWIHIDDLISQILFILENNLPFNAFNGVSPAPVTNEVFTTTLTEVLGRRNFLPVPSFFLKLTLGEMSTLLLASQRVMPSRLIESGFSFEYPTLDLALKKEVN